MKSLAIIPAPGAAAAPVPRNVPPQGELQVGVGVLSDRLDPEPSYQPSRPRRTSSSRRSW